MNDPADGLVYCSLPHLLALQSQVNTLRLAARRIKARNAGAHRSVFHGRGMDFAESRPYQAGDDIRNIDWRVTARIGTAHTKLYQEEREKPVLFWLDLRAPMFFATRGQFKNVVITELAVLLMWKALADGDRVGFFVQSDNTHSEHKPARTRSATLHQLQELVSVSQQRPPVVNPTPKLLEQSWSRLRRVAQHDSHVYIMSDFRGADQAALNQISRMRRHARVHLVSIHDPLEQQLSGQGTVMLTDGERRSHLNLSNTDWRQNYAERARASHDTIKTFASKQRIPLIELSTAEDPLVRIQKVGRWLS